MHTKSRAIKSLIAEFTTVLLDELPVALDGLVFMRFSIELIHDLNTKTAHSTAKMLDNMETIQNDFSRRKEFLSDVVVRAKHVHCNDFHSISDLSGIPQKVIANSHLSPSV